MNHLTYVCFDDTDTLDADRGTGKLARWFADELPDGCRVRAVVRQQLLVDPAVPYTSHNSAACVIVEGPRRVGLIDDLIERATAHLERHALAGSDPGLCVVADDSPALPHLQAFGTRAAAVVVSKAEAFEAARGAHLSEHGGSGDGVVGAAAGVGLSSAGWSGRLIEYTWEGGGLRDFPDPVSVDMLRQAGVVTLSLDRDAPVPLDTDLVRSDGWLRPRLWGGQPALPVVRAPQDEGGWVCVGPRTAPRASAT